MSAAQSSTVPSACDIKNVFRDFQESSRKCLLGTVGDANSAILSNIVDDNAMAPPKTPAERLRRARAINALLRKQLGLPLTGRVDCGSAPACEASFLRTILRSAKPPGNTVALTKPVGYHVSRDQSQQTDLTCIANVKSCPCVPPSKRTYTIRSVEELILIAKQGVQAFLLTNDGVFPSTLCLTKSELLIRREGGTRDILSMRSIVDVVLGQNHDSFAKIVSVMSSLNKSQRCDLQAGYDFSSHHSILSAFYRSLTIVCAGEKVAYSLIMGTPDAFNAAIVALEAYVLAPPHFGAPAKLDDAAVVGVMQSLSEEEKRLCLVHHVLPTQYVTLKRRLFTDGAPTIVAPSELLEIVNIDMWRLGVVLRYFSAKGWVRLRTIFESNVDSQNSKT